MVYLHLSYGSLQELGAGPGLGMYDEVGGTEGGMGLWELNMGTVTVQLVASSWSCTSEYSISYCD